jgi:hypothetical protein
MVERTPYRMERLDDSRLKDVQYLYQVVFKKSISLDTLTKKYDTSYLGVKHIAYLAYDRDNPVAFYGALPQRIINNGASILSAQTCDSITLPVYQGKGIHKMLALKSYELMREYGVRFVYSFLNENSFHSCKKLDWGLAFIMKGFLIKTNMASVLKATRKIAVLNQHVDSYIKTVLAPYTVDYENLVNSNFNDGYSIEYSTAFFSHKSFTNNLVIEVDNVRFWVKVSSGIMVGDVNFNSESDLLRGIASLKKLTFKIGVNEVLFQTTPGTKLEQVLSENYKGFESWKVGYYLIDKTIDPFQLKVNFGDVDTF